MHISTAGDTAAARYQRSSSADMLGRLSLCALLLLPTPPGSLFLHLLKVKPAGALPPDYQASFEEEDTDGTASCAFSLLAEQCPLPPTPHLHPLPQLLI